MRRTTSGARLNKIRKRSGVKKGGKKNRGNRQRLAKHVILGELREEKQKRRMEDLIQRSKVGRRGGLLVGDGGNGEGFEEEEEEERDPRVAYEELVRLMPVIENDKESGENDVFDNADQNLADEVDEADQITRSKLPPAHELCSTHFSRILTHEAAQLLQNSTAEYSAALKYGNLRISKSPSDASLDVSSFPRMASELGFLPGILEKWLRMRQGKHNLTPVEAATGFGLQMWKDVMICDGECREELRDIYIGHCLSHIVRSRRRVVKNDKAAKKKDEEGEVEGEVERDQGFSRARVLLVVGMKNSAYELIKRVGEFAVGVVRKSDEFLGEVDGEGEGKDGGVAQVANWARFVKEFGPGEESDGGNDDEKGSKRRRCSDYDYIFRGNVDDDFKIGMAMTRKTLRLYTDFYSSDIIVASPLGLRRALEASAMKRHHNGPDNDDDASKMKRMNGGDDDDSADFLSSIEVCVVDECEILSMQNWETLLFVLKHLNHVPKKPRDTDFSRVYEWALDGLAKYYRQTIVLSSYPKPEVSAIFRSFRNHSGSMKIIEPAPEAGTMKSISINVKQTFYHVTEVKKPSMSPDRRFENFTKKLLPTLREKANIKPTLVFIPSYYDLVRVRNYLIQLNEDDPSFKFGSITEYTNMGEVTRIRGFFFNKRIEILLVTERLHFYRRYKIRGASRVVFYGMPEMADFYPAVVDMLKEASDKGEMVNVVGLYDRWDVLALERIVGRQKAKRMTAVSTAKEVYIFE